jgi:hypothetical protein
VAVNSNKLLKMQQKNFWMTQGAGAGQPYAVCSAQTLDSAVEEL